MPNKEDSATRHRMVVEEIEIPEKSADSQSVEPQEAAPVEQPKSDILDEGAKVSSQEIIEEQKPIEEKVITSGGLRYFADDGAGLPEISNETRVFTAAEKNIVPLAPLRRETFASAQNKKHSRIKIFTLAGAGLAVFIFCAVVSSAVSLNLSIEAGNTASAFYTIGF